jgi:hypothetical protein
LEALRSSISTPYENTYAYSLIAAAARTHQEVLAAGEARLTCIKRVKAKKILAGEERVAEHLVYSRYFDSISSECGGNVVDGLLSTPEDK